MPKRTILLKELLQQRNAQSYASFCSLYDAAAVGCDPPAAGRRPSRGQFARWLNGDLRGLPGADHRRVLEAMFPGHSVHQLFAEAGQAGPAPRAHVIPAARRAPGSQGTPPARPTAPAEPVGGRAEPGGGRAEPVTGRAEPVGSRVEPVGGRAGSLGSGAAPAGRAADSGPRLNSPPGERAVTTQEPARVGHRPFGGVDHDVLDRLAADVRRLAVDHLVRPPLTLFPPLTRMRAEVFDLLDRRQRPGHLPPLYAVAGRLCALLAHASADLGQGHAAETHTRTAWLCADLADDDSLRAYVRWVQSNVAYWDGEYRQAAQIAHSGQRYATRGGNLLRLASQEARAWAACGETAATEKALALAGRVRDQEVPDDQAGVFRFDPGKAAYYASEVRLALGGPANARAAVREATDALALFESAAPEHRCPEFDAAARLDLAQAHLALSDLDAAAVHLRIVLRLPVESRTEPVVGRVTAAGRTLRSATFAGSALASQLGEEIALFRAYPARRDPSEALG